MKLVDPSQQRCALLHRRHRRLNQRRRSIKGTRRCYVLRETGRESHCRSESATSCLAKVFQSGNTHVDRARCTFYKAEALLGGREDLRKFFYVSRGV